MNSSRSKKDSRMSGSRRKAFELLLRDRGIDLFPVNRIPKRDPSQPSLLSLAQERIWRECKSHRGTFPPEGIILRFSGALNLSALIQGLNEVIRRHEILRTSFVEMAGAPDAHISPQAGIEVSVADLRRLSAVKKHPTAESICGEQIEKPIDLQRAPLLRGNVITFDASNQLLVITLHRLICDAWSKELVVDELSRCYAAYSTGVEHGMEEPELQYSDFAGWQRARLANGELNEDINYWREKVSSLELAKSPDETAMVAESMEACHEVRLNSETLEHVNQISRRYGFTPFQVLLTAWQVLLSQLTARKRVTVGTIVSGRNRLDLQDLMGPVSMTLPVTTEVDRASTFRGLLTNVRDELIEALEHEDALLAGQIESRSVTRENPHWFGGLAFTMERTLVEGSEFPGTEVAEEYQNRTGGITRSFLTMRVRTGATGLCAWIEWNARRFDAEQTAWVDNYQRLIAAAAANLDSSPSLSMS